MSRTRGSFSGALAKEWMEAALQSWTERGNVLQDVVVCDNALCHNGLNSFFEDSAAEFVSKLWFKGKAKMKSAIRILAVASPGVVGQRIFYVENIVDQAMNVITLGDYARAAQH